MKAYIHGAGCISPQDTASGAPFLENVRSYEGNRLAVADPDYKQWIDVKLIRRMSRVIKMGVGASQLSLQDAGITMPDAIITGTAYGCLADTSVFLNKMVSQQEEMLTPTAFIQSTHNTVAGQIALMLGCHAYNNTFVHRAFSFESALLDSLMILQEGSAKTVLAGGLDEITDHSHTILSRFGLFRTNSSDSTKLLNEAGEGTINGEGSGFFVLSSEQGNATVAIHMPGTLYKPSGREEVKTFIEQYLGDTVPDVIITGRSGDAANDAILNDLEDELFAGKPVAGFKHLSGEYPTASAFALFMAVQALRTQKVALLKGTAPASFKNILIVNQYQGTHYSASLVSAC
ncbi:beta-ketoacyl synthase chain length factor [Chitinophaga horti]|uniref:Beta-ketoacyl synthase chain length factor n=1 Tax=Chitinophaga horti TaxID=2920382 RepID=A0ABY6J2J7_9BACT|nr:beta-ketoacyl synthase N-terminal-like domain-containing protein [Chitinophaga horti]UYQ93888.1 beta-ketoacyl synthase chain length factor [Chitinophaga horti]